MQHQAMYTNLVPNYLAKIVHTRPTQLVRNAACTSNVGRPSRSSMNVLVLLLSGIAEIIELAKHLLGQNINVVMVVRVCFRAQS